MSELAALADRLSKAGDYTEIFPTQSDITPVYRKLARIVHPDGKTGADLGTATYSFQLLNKFKADAEQMATEGRFGTKVLLDTIVSRKAKHEVRNLWTQGDLANLYKATTTVDGVGTFSLVKVARSPKDNDLLVAEARALKKLFAEDHVLQRHFPVLLDSFPYKQGRRRTNVLGFLDGYYSLQELMKPFDEGIPPVHLAWIWRRVLMALGYAHEHGIVHGAVLPPHIMVEPITHAVVLVDWCYSVVIDDESKTTVKAVVPVFKSAYPEEVLNKEQPSAATDLYLAARCMLWATTNKAMPRQMQAYFKGCLLTSQNMRPQNAWLLLEEFDDLLKHLGGPYYPRRFVELAVPAGSA